MFKTKWMKKTKIKMYLVKSKAKMQKLKKNLKFTCQPRKERFLLQILVLKFKTLKPLRETV